ncbi:keratin-associated protein 20-2-like [Meriones unguiculatus]|uniref:keratin-associated protein 20-2-like n=1 Tax=Meriones unguiculatus TaxID=10047 RepID=UPI00108E92DB|nr:keratin-associated protein 20-2-like [Meriones unguiculatus]
MCYCGNYYARLGYDYGCGFGCGYGCMGYDCGYGRLGYGCYHPCCCGRYWSCGFY